MARVDLRRVERAAARIATATSERNEAILAAYRSGETLRDIGRAANLSHQRVHQIIREQEKQSR